MNWDALLWFIGSLVVLVLVVFAVFPFLVGFFEARGRSFSLFALMDYFAQLGLRFGKRR